MPVCGVLRARYKGRWPGNGSRELLLVAVSALVEGFIDQVGDVEGA